MLGRGGIDTLAVLLHYGGSDCMRSSSTRSGACRLCGVWPNVEMCFYDQRAADWSM